MIILGDFGVIRDYKGPNGAEKYWLDWLEDKSFTTLFINGNLIAHLPNYTTGFFTNPSSSAIV